jgi:hypothetical protein
MSAIWSLKGEKRTSRRQPNFVPIDPLRTSSTANHYGQAALATAGRFGVAPARPAADTGYGSAERLGWLVEDRGIEPHISPRIDRDILPNALNTPLEGCESS